MDGPNSDEHHRVLYLQQVEIVTDAKITLRIKVKIGNKEFGMRHEQRTSVWTPTESLEIPGDSKITVVIKTGHSVGGIQFGKLEARAEVSSEEAVKAFWDSIDSVSPKDSVSCATTFGQHPATITFKFRPSQTSETTRTAVCKLQREMESYGSLDLMKGTTEAHIDTAFRIGVAFAELNPMAGVAFSLATAIFDVLKEQRKYDGMVADLALGVDRILQFAKRTLEDALYDEADLLEGVIRKMYELIVDTASFICSYARRSPVFRMLKSVILLEDHAKISGLHDNFTTLKEAFDRAVDVEALTLARKNEINRLLDLLRPVREANYQDDHQCMEGTRTAVLDEIMTWVGKKPLDKMEEKPLYQAPSISNVRNIYWLYGMPGLGKTSVANSLCYRLHKTGNLGGSFFCKRDSPTLRDPKRVLPTLISKLAAMWSPYRTLVAQALRDDPQLNPESTDGELLLKPLQGLRKQPPRTYVLVIDALDECGEESSRKELLDCLLAACSRVEWLKIVITSRPERDVRTFFETASVISRDLAEDDKNETDIRNFAAKCMSLLVERRNLSKGWPGVEHFNQIIERSRGLFIYIDTIYRFLGAYKDPDVPLGLVLGGQRQDAYAELHKLYSTAIKSQVGQEADKFRSLARAIIAVAAYHPLCDEALASLMDQKPHVVKTWVDDLGSIFYRDKEGGIRVRHLSILEFLTGSSCPLELRVDLSQANGELSHYCLTRMIQELEFNICGLETSYLPNSDIKGLDKAVQNNISDALKYSCLYWSGHLCYDLDPPSKELGELLFIFFTGKWPLYWLEVLSLTANVPIATLALRTIMECKKKLEEQTQHLVEDALHFVLTFFTPISTSAPHIYVSALPFMPLRSALWNNVHVSFPNLVHVCEGRMQEWPARAGVWQGHTESVRSVAYSPNSRHVVTGSYDNTIRIWDAETGVMVGEPLRGHDGEVNCVAYSPNSQYVVSGSDDTTIRIWDISTRAGVPLTGHTGWVYSVSYSSNGQRIASGSSDGTIRIWDAKSGTAVRGPLRGHTGSVYSVAYSPDGRHIVSGSGDHMIRIWDAKEGTEAREPLKGHAGTVYSVAYSPDGKHIASGSEDKTIRIWNVTTGATVHHPLKGHTKPVNSVKYSPDGQHIVSASRDNTIRIWDVMTGAAVGLPLRGHNGWVRSVSYSPNGQYIASGSGDNTIRIWDVKTGAAVGGRLSGHTSSVYSVAYSPTGECMVSGSRDGTIRIWDTMTGTEVGEEMRGHTDWVYSVSYSPNGQHLVSGSRDTTIRIWDVTTSRSVGTPLRGHIGWVYSVSYSPNGQHIASCSSDRTIRIWDAKTGTAVGGPLRGHAGPVYSVAYSPDGRHIVSGSGDHTIRIWDAEEGIAIIEPLKGHTGQVYSVAYSPNGENIVSGCRNGTIRIWDAVSGAAVGESLEGHTDVITSVAYSPDGHYIVSSSRDTTIRIWDSATGEAEGEPLRGHTNEALAVAYSPNGQHIVSGSEDNTIRLWNATVESENSGVLSGSQVLHHRVNTETPVAPDHPQSGYSIAQESMDANGWVRCADGLLLWVPEDCRPGLTSPAIMAIPTEGRHRRVRINFTQFRHGTSWTDVSGGA